MIGDVWLDVHRAAHELGLNTNATMLYGHVERVEERVGHMIQLRRQQDRALADWASIVESSPSRIRRRRQVMRSCSPALPR